jgi:hypothetical protein
MEEKSQIKKEMFEDLINANKDFIKSHIDAAEKAEFKKELREKMDSFQGTTEQTFNKTDHYRIPIIYSFYTENNKYWDEFTIGEMEFLGIFKNKYNDEALLEKVANEYLGYLNKNNKNNSLSHLKALIGSNSRPEISGATKEKIKNLTKLVDNKNQDSLEIKKEIAYICRDLKITGEFIAHCNREKKKEK